MYIINIYTIQYIHIKTMNIILSNSSKKPIYEQITDQMKVAILSGELRSGVPLPSMRTLANELRISVITTKRAFNDLEAEGYIESVQGKGSFVSAIDPETLKEFNLKKIEGDLQRSVEAAINSGISLEEMTSMLGILYKESKS